MSWSKIPASSPIVSLVKYVGEKKKSQLFTWVIILTLNEENNLVIVSMSSHAHVWVEILATGHKNM